MSLLLQVFGDRQPGRRNEQESDCPKDKPCARLYQLLVELIWEPLRESWALGESWAVWDLGVTFLEVEMKLLLFALNQNFSDFSGARITCSCWIAAK